MTAKKINGKNPNTLKLLVRGQQLESEAYSVRNIGKEENLRGGSTGARIQGTHGPVSIGCCPRKAQLRVLGVEEPFGLSKSFMFQGGHGSEEYLNKSLEAAWKEQDPQNLFFPEGIVGVRWSTASGRPVTGTPDGLFAAPAGDHVALLKGIEAKCMSSGFTLINSVLKEKPNTSHLLQAGHYAWQLGIPFDLVYISRVNFGLHYWMKGMIKDLEPHPCYQFAENGEHFAFSPTEAVYQIEWHNDRLVYHTPQGNRIETHVKTGDIRAFYDHVDQSLNDKTLADKGSSKDILGDTAYLPCKYCPHNQHCPSVPNGASGDAYEAWLEQCIRDVTECDIPTEEGLPES